MPSSGAVSERETVLRRLWRLLEFSLDAARNEDDADFVRRGGRINYVVDENIFECFVNPYRKRRFAEFFHSRHWWRPGRDRWPAFESINAQGAMLASEFLLSGTLPGQVDRRLFMTEWHFRELRDRTAKLVEEYERRLSNEDVGANELDAFLRLAEQSTLLEREAPDLDALSARADAMTRQDVRHLRGKRSAAPDLLARFVLCRRAASLLVADRLTEPLQQLNRIFSAEIAPRLSPLHTRFRPTDAERAMLRVSTQDWMKRLRTERDRRAVASAPALDDAESRDQDEERKDGSLHADARSLAYLHWISESKLSPLERIVFVTADTLTYDAYRLWHTGGVGSGPFLLRRMTQYAPILNLSDSPSDVEDARELFETTRENLEVPLIAFNMARGEVDTREAGRALELASWRQHFAYRLSRAGSLERDPLLKLFTDRLDGDWMSDRWRQFEALKRSWQTLERTAIGANLQLVRRRLDGPLKKRADALASLGEAHAGEAFAAILGELLGEIRTSSIKLWFPLAGDFIRSAEWRSEFRNGPPRTPLALRLRVPGSQASAKPDALDINNLIDRWSSGDEAAGASLDPSRNRALAAAPAVVFAIAGALALRVSHWSDAQRFAELAYAAASRNDEPKSTPSDQLEMAYLKALAMRFWMGNTDPVEGGIMLATQLQNLQRIVEILDACVEAHQRGTARRQALRETRAISERAAARLFCASWVVLTAEGDAASESSRSAVVSALLRSAAEDLEACRQLEPDLINDTKPDDHLRRGYLKRLKLQYMTNIAANGLIAHLAGRRFDWPASLSRLDQPAAQALSEFIDELRANKEFNDLPIVVRADLWGYQALCDDVQDSRREFRALVKEHGPRMRLAIDRAVLRAVSEELKGQK